MTLGNKTPAETFPKFPSVLRDNTQDCQKFWKRFRGCFVFQSRVSLKTVVLNQIRECKNPKEKISIYSKLNFNGFTGVKLNVSTDELTHILLLYSQSG